jgi:hypothetical protein
MSVYLVSAVLIQRTRYGLSVRAVRFVLVVAAPPMRRAAAPARRPYDFDLREVRPGCWA